jgi:ribonuclease R
MPFEIDDQISLQIQAQMIAKELNKYDDIGKIMLQPFIRTLRKAKYSPENIGHFGLASKNYVHFTSPIRRYPDTTVHRLLRTYMFNKDMSAETIHHWEEKLVYVTDHSSVKERSSIDCEREVEDMKMAEYMEGHIGET